MKKKLFDLFFEHDANRVDKWEQYLAMYQSELASFISGGMPVRLLEIGVQNGGSLELWSKYLPPGSVIRGIDIDENVRELAFTGGDIAAVVADATDASKIEELFGGETFDIIIDDGSHYSSHIITSFSLLFHHLNPGGKYIIEDLHCSYYGSHQGGYRVGHSSIEWLKHLIDVLNADHIAAGTEIAPAEQELFAAYRTSLGRISFYDSVAVIEKLAVEKTRAYLRLLSGERAKVLTDEQWLSREPIETFRPILFGHPAARHLEPRLIACVDEARSHAGRLDEALNRANREIDEARQRLLQQETEASEALARLNLAHQEELRAALRVREAAHQDQIQAALAASEAAHRHDLRTRLDAQEAAFRNELGVALAAAVTLRKGVQANLAKLRRDLREALPLARVLRPGAAEKMTRRRREAALCRKLFDRAWYLRQNPDVAADKVDPFTHYLTSGAIEGRDPHPLFDTSWYLERNPDVAAAKVNPLVHYLQHGAAEGRDPCPLFQTSWYLRMAPDVLAAGVNPLVHFVMHGAAEGRDPNPLFDTSWYLEQNPDVAAAGKNALVHYLMHGVAEGRDPNELFDTDWYLAVNPDVAAAGMNPLAHYLLAGRAEGRLPADANFAYGKQVLRERQQFVLELPEIRQHIQVMLYKPTFVVIVEGPDGPDRRRTVASLERQIYPHWSVCDLAGDSPVPKRVPVNDDVFFVWLRVGDALSERALYAFASALNRDPSTDLVYADEDRCGDDGARSKPFYKPAWSPDYLESFNYIGPAACFRSSIATACWPQCRSYYDFLLRFTEGTSRIQHIGEVLCHRSRSATEAESKHQVADDVAALEGRLQRTGRTGAVGSAAPGVGCYDINIQLSSSPLVSVILPTAGKVVDFEGRRIDLLFNCLDTVRDRSTYRNLEFIIVDNGDLAPQRVDELRRRGCKTITFREERVNIAKKMNLGVSIATGEMLLLLNDDIEPISTDWIERLLEPFEKPHVGLVGARLLYPNGSIQHAGVVITRGSPDHVRRAYPGDDLGYFFSTCATRNFSAVTGACMMTRTELYRRIGGYNEALAINYNDIDYCLRVRECGLSVVYAPRATLTHLESASRAAVLGSAEQAYFHKRWAHMVTTDPFYSESSFADYPATFEIRYNPRWL